MTSESTGRHVWVFDRDRRAFSPHPQFKDEVSVRCITSNPVTRQLVWTKADEGFWWTATLGS